MGISPSGLLVFDNRPYESADQSGMSWLQESFPATGPKNVVALATGLNGWVLDVTTVPTLWRRTDQTTFVQLVTGDLSIPLPRFFDFYTGGFPVVGDIGAQNGRQVFAVSFDGGATVSQITPFPTNLFPLGSTFVRFWADERAMATTPPRSGPLRGFFMVQVRDPQNVDHLYTSPDLASWNSLNVPNVQNVGADFIRKQNGTYLVSVTIPPSGAPAIARSADGVNWDPPRYLPGNALPQPGLVECDDGTVLVPSIGAQGGLASPGLVFRSTDDGQSFQDSGLTSPGVSTAHVWLKYFPILNALFAYVSQDTGTSTTPEAVYLSTDQGQSWAQVFTP